MRNPRNLARALATACYLLTAPAGAHHVPMLPPYNDGNGKLWLQPHRLSEKLVGGGFLAWFQFESRCPLDGVTPCSGSFNFGGTRGTFDLTGWVWATYDQVDALFHQLTLGAFPITPFAPPVSTIPPPAFQVTGVRETWAHDILANVFEPTVNSRTQEVEGLTSSYLGGPPPQFYMPIYGRISATTVNVGGIPTPISRASVATFNDSPANLTAFLFKPVPLPAAAWLLLGGLAALASTARGRRRKR